MAQAVTKTEEKKEKDYGMFDPRWFLTDEYKNLFPADDPSWIDKPLVGIKDNEKKYDSSTIDNFVPPDEKKPHKYYALVKEALETFKKWNKWGVAKDQWVLKVEHKEINHTGYIHEFPGSDIPATKEIMIYPYNVAVLAGFLANSKFAKEYDPTLDKIVYIDALGWYASISHSQIKLGIPFVSDRDFLTVDAVYDLGNGEILILSTSLNDKDYKHENYKPNKNYVRGTIELSAIHLRPYYEKDINQTVLTEYSYAKMNGSMPGWVVKQFAACENQKYVREWMDKNKKKIAKAGAVYISPELLQFVDLKTIPPIFEKYKDLLTEFAEQYK